MKSQELLYAPHGRPEVVPVRTSNQGPVHQQVSAESLGYGCMLDPISQQLVPIAGQARLCSFHDA